MDLFNIIFLIFLILVVVIVGITFFRNANINYRIGKGMFEDSENNLDEKPDFSDKEYYDGDKGLFK